MFRIYLVAYFPINTFTSPEIIFPPCAVISPILAAGKPSIRTVLELDIIDDIGPLHLAGSPSLAEG